MSENEGDNRIFGDLSELAQLRGDLEQAKKNYICLQKLAQAGDVEISRHVLRLSFLQLKSCKSSQLNLLSSFL